MRSHEFRPTSNAPYCGCGLPQRNRVHQPTLVVEPVALHLTKSQVETLLSALAYLDKDPDTGKRAQARIESVSKRLRTYDNRRR